MEKMESLKRYGTKAQGGKELKSHLEGKRLTQRRAILAKCYDCMGFYADGRISCQIPSCSLFPFMPYRAVSGASETEEKAV